MSGSEDKKHQIRVFDTGATRDTDSGKWDFEGFFHPAVMCRFAKYMNDHRVQADGNLRSSDNWQKGIPVTAYMKSMFRHFVDLWSMHRNLLAKGRVTEGGFISSSDELDETWIDSDLDAMEEMLCALSFNVNGYLLELLKKRGKTR